uniref:Coenzyme Q-binding protein COQ10 START domain-containing protein n=1 Tax=Chrysotila carterae TaxID=13221 RepID=A0A7S4F8J8_CHRCT|mmetsp:Transcript_58520/g.127091  ORF Transcript_58520/g.127091 Transcript_58520/m.127091 type:complete len:251 (-) Transcript_58520:954-1706(-)
MIRPMDSVPIALAVLCAITGEVGAMQTTQRFRLQPQVRRHASRSFMVMSPFATDTSSGATPVNIAVTGFNSRCISASTIINAPPKAVWKIITDYDNLSTHVPNLVTSERRPHPSGGIRLFQEGAQKIAGFDFRASLTMDMHEDLNDSRRGKMAVEFKLVESRMFAAFEGVWRLQPYSRVRSTTNPDQYDYTTKLFYQVDITPKGLVPVPALEWRIREDVPVNLKGVKVAAERLHSRRQQQLLQQQQQQQR